MKHLLAAMLLVFTCSTASAGLFGSDVTNNRGGAGGDAVAGAIAGSKSVSQSKSYSNATAKQQQGQYQGQGQGQGQSLNNKNRSSSNNNGGNVSISNIQRKNVRHAPSFGLPAAFPTAVCQGTIAAGFSFWLGGAAGAGTITIEECMKMETIRLGVLKQQNSVTVADAVAQQKANDEVWCMTKYGSQTSLCGAPLNVSAVDVPVVAIVAPKKVEGLDDVVVRELTLSDLTFWD